jgi:hypothetical protein
MCDKKVNCVGRIQSLSILWHLVHIVTTKLKINSVAWVREELYRPSDRSLSAKLVSTFADRGSHVVSVTDPYDRILGFLDRSRYFFFQVAPQLYSRGWVNPVPDPLLLLFMIFLLFFFIIGTCFGLLDHHQVVYTIITNIIKMYNGSVVFRSASYLYCYALFFTSSLFTKLNCHLKCGFYTVKLCPYVSKHLFIKKVQKYKKFKSLETLGQSFTV